MYTSMYIPITTNQFGQMSRELEAEVARNWGGKAGKSDFSYTRASAPDMAQLIAVVLMIGAPLVALFLA